jgi:hypothetical protein
MHLLSLTYSDCDIFAYMFRSIIQSIFRATFLLQEYSVSKRAKLLHNIVIPLLGETAPLYIIGYFIIV